MFFSGHGYKNSDDNKGFGVAFKTGGLTTDDTWPMEHAKVAMWAACYSANATNNKKISIAEYSVKMGAKAAVGFSESVGFSSSKTFTNRFFDKLAAGWTVKTAASHAAKGLLWPWDAGKKYKIFGNESTSVTSSTVSQSSFAPVRIDYDLLEDLKENAYVVSLGSNEERYYQTINGRLTNSFVDVTVSDGVVVSVDDCRKDFAYIQPISPSYLNKAVPQEIEKTGEIYHFAGRDFRHIVYFSDGQLMTPYEIVTADYVRNTDIIQETTCVSLTDGASIDYSLINAAA